MICDVLLCKIKLEHGKYINQRPIYVKIYEIGYLSGKWDNYQLKIHILDKKKKDLHTKLALKEIFFNLFDYAKTVKCLMTYAKSNK